MSPEWVFSFVLVGEILTPMKVVMLNGLLQVQSVMSKITFSLTITNGEPSLIFIRTIHSKYTYAVHSVSHIHII